MGVPIGPEASRAIKRKAKMCDGYKAIRPKVTWTIKVCAIYEYEAVGYLSIYILSIVCISVT